MTVTTTNESASSTDNRTDNEQLADELLQCILSSGEFDNLRRSFMSRVDSKPVYSQLTQRVSGITKRFLENQRWGPNVNKVQVRADLRRLLTNHRGLSMLIDRLINDVLNTHVVLTEIKPKVDEAVSKYLGGSLSQLKDRKTPEQIQQEQKQKMIQQQMVVPHPPLPSVSDVIGPPVVATTQHQLPPSFMNFPFPGFPFPFPPPFSVPPPPPPPEEDCPPPPPPDLQTEEEIVFTEDMEVEEEFVEEFNPTVIDEVTVVDKSQQDVEMIPVASSSSMKSDFDFAWKDVQLDINDISDVSVSSVHTSDLSDNFESDKEKSKKEKKHKKTKMVDESNVKSGQWEDDDVVKKETHAKQDKKQRRKAEIEARLQEIEAQKKLIQRGKVKPEKPERRTKQEMKEKAYLDKVSRRKEERRQMRLSREKAEQDQDNKAKKSSATTATVVSAPPASEQRRKKSSKSDKPVKTVLSPEKSVSRDADNIYCPLKLPGRRTLERDGSKASVKGYSYFSYVSRQDDNGCRHSRSPSRRRHYHRSSRSPSASYRDKYMDEPYHHHYVQRSSSGHRQSSPSTVAMDDSYTQSTIESATVERQSDPEEGEVSDS